MKMPLLSLMSLTAEILIATSLFVVIHGQIKDLAESDHYTDPSLYHPRIKIPDLFAKLKSLKKFRSKSPTSSFDDVLYRYILSYAGNLKQIDKRKCLDPSISWLQDLLAAGYMLHLDKLEKLYENKQQEQSISVENRAGYYNSSFVKKRHCDTDKLNSTLINLRGVCPWRYQVLYREGMYPPYREFVICQCINCTIDQNTVLKDPVLVNYECMPVYVKMPVMVRNNSEKCDSAGYSHWSVEYEWVSIACICGKKYNNTIESVSKTLYMVN